MAQQKLTLELELKSAKYKEKLNEAQRALLALENKALKAGGANEVLAKKIAKANNSLKIARNEYNLTNNSLKKYALEASKAGTAMGKMNNKMRGSNQGFTQLAYAMDDMQYGFQGVQNNIQAIAVSMGASGGLVIGLTAVVIAIGLVAKKFEKMGREAKEAAKIASKAFADAQGPIVKLEMFADAVKDSETNTYQFKNAMVELKKMGFDPVNGALDEFVKKKTAMIKLNAIESATVQSVSKKIAEQLTLQNEINQAIKKTPVLRVKDGLASASGPGASGYEISQIQDKVDRIAELETQIADISKTGRDTAAKLIAEAGLTALDVVNPKGAKESGERAGAAYFEGYENWLLNKDQMSVRIYQDLNDGIKKSLELQKAQGVSKRGLLESELAQLQAVDKRFIALKEEEAILHRVKVLQAEIASMPGMMDSGMGLNESDIAFEKLKSNLTEVKAMFEAGLFGMDEYLRRIENISLAFGRLDEAKERSSQFDKMLQQSMANIVTGFAQAAGSGEDMGKALLAGIGNTLMQLGGMLVLTGIGVEAFKTSLGTLNGAGAIVAGAAMVAAGAAFASAANKAGGGGGGSSSGGSRPSSSSTVMNNPVRENARVRNSNLIIPTDMLRYGMQNAEDNYSGFN